MVLECERNVPARFAGKALPSHRFIIPMRTAGCIGFGAIPTHRRLRKADSSPIHMITSVDATPTRSATHLS